MTIANVVAVASAGEQAERHRDGGDRRQPEQPDVDRLGELRIPVGVGLVEGVPVGLAVQAVGEERPQVQEHDRAGQHPQQGEGPHADRRGRAARRRAARSSGALALVAPHAPRPGVDRRCARRSPWPPGTGSRGRAACCSRPSRARTSRNASWLSSPASAWWRTAGYLSPASGTSSSQRYPDHGSLDGHAPAVGGDPDHVRAPGARLREHLERELLVVGPVAPRHEPELQDHDGDDHHPPRDDSDPRRHAATMTPPLAAACNAVHGVLRGRHLAARRRPGALRRAPGGGPAAAAVAIRRPRLVAGGAAVGRRDGGGDHRGGGERGRPDLDRAAAGAARLRARAGLGGTRRAAVDGRPRRARCSPRRWSRPTIRSAVSAGSR